MAVREDIVGTWFPSGYFGHFRSKTRNDILQEYRHAASPSPPNKFTNRVRLCPDRHQFSKHDNRHSFPTDASYFDTGLGRRKSGRSSAIFKPDFIAWQPHLDELKKEGAAVSVYRLDYRHGDTTPEPTPQRLSPRVRRRMAFQDENLAKQKWVTDYKMYFQHGQPNPKIDTDFNTGRDYEGHETNSRAYQNVNATGKLRKVVPHYLAHTEAVKRRVKSAPLMYLGVGDCLVWPQQQLNDSIVIPNRYDKRSENYKFKNPLAAKLPRKWRDSKPPTRDELLKPEPYHWREKVHLRPPAAEKRERERKSESYVRVPPSTPQETITENGATTPRPPATPRGVTNGDVTSVVTPRPPITSHSDVTNGAPQRPPVIPRVDVTPVMTPRPPATPRESFMMSPPPMMNGAMMTPAATPVTCFSPPSAPPTWVTQNTIPTVVVN